MFLNDAEVSLKQAHSFLLKARLCQSRTAFPKSKNEDGIPFVFGIELSVFCERESTLCFRELKL